MTPKRILVNLPVVALCSMLISSIATILWAANKGLGIGDEGVYLLSARHPEDITQNVSAVYIYTGFLFKTADYDIATFRIAGMALILASAFVFWYGFNKYFELSRRFSHLKHTRTLSLMFICVGALLYYQWFFATPNNYTLTAISVNIFAGSLFLGLAPTGHSIDQKKPHLFPFFITGLSMALAWFVKITTGAALIFVFLLFIVLYHGIGARRRVSILLSTSIGFGCWCLGHFSLAFGPETAWRLFWDGWALYQSFGVHVPHIKIFLYGEEIIFMFLSAVFRFWLGYAIMTLLIVYFFFRNHPARRLEELQANGLLWVMIVATGLSIDPGVNLARRTTTDKSIPFYLVFHLSWVLLLLTSALWATWQNKTAFRLCKRDRAAACNSLDSGNYALILLLLIILPIVAAVGTANPIFNVTGFYSVPWFGAIFLLLMANLGTQRGVLIVPFVLVVVGAFSTSQIIQGSLFNPQQINTNLYRQVVPTSVGFPRRTLNLDRSTHDLVRRLNMIARDNGFQPGDDIVAISYLPSLVFAMGGRSPGHPAFLTGTEASLVYTKLALQFADLERLKKSLVLLNIDVKLASDLLASRGLDFPARYKMIGTVASDSVWRAKFYYSLWKPRSF